MFIHFSDADHDYIYKMSLINSVAHRHGGLTINIEFSNGNCQIFSFDSKDAALDTYQYILNQFCDKGGFKYV